jgi:high-affinity Fe2+/Pb2+ permease
MLVFAFVPVQTLAIVYVAGIFAATSQRSPVANASLAAGAIAGLATGLATTLVFYEAAGDDNYAILLLFGMITMLFLLAALAGAAAAWRLSATGDPQDLRAARVRQGLLAGAVTGAVCGLLLTNFSILAGMVMMVLGPLTGLGGGALGGALSADHPRQARHDHSWAAGLFVLRS